jgi:tetratricopeptide (TPR) repeat protein
MIDRALSTPRRGDRPASVADYTARAAMPARYAVERGDWAAAAALGVDTTPYPQADALSRFARGLGQARTGNVPAAREEIAALQALREQLTTAGERYWAERTQEQIVAVSAWIALTERAPGRAVALMREAADGEDGSLKHVAMENRLYPLRELLGDLLLEAGDAQAALVEYRKALQQTPNRLRGLYGAARAADAAGDSKSAIQYYAALIDLTKAGDGLRPEVRQAQAYLAARR